MKLALDLIAGILGAMLGLAAIATLILSVALMTGAIQ